MVVGPTKFIEGKKRDRENGNEFDVGALRTITIKLPARSVISGLAGHIVEELELAGWRYGYGSQEEP